MLVLKILTVFTGISFIIYGISCLTTSHMKQEFVRYGLGLGNFRVFTGYAQLVGALGLLFGLMYYPLGFCAALGLTVLMALGFMTRMRINDGFLASSPSFIFMLINAYICFSFYKLIYPI